MSVSCSPVMSLTATEVLETNVPAAQNPTVVHNGFNLAGITLNASTTPAITKPSFRTYQLTAGTVTIDLTALLGTNNLSQDCTGLKVQALIIHNPAGNATMNVAPGASNGYALFGTSNDIEITAGGYVQAYLPEGLPDVASGAKNITITGTGTQEIHVGLLLG